MREHSFILPNKTSMSDDSLYPIFCEAAATDDSFFSTFRRNRIYNDILEHVSYEQGQAYLDEINKSFAYSPTEFFEFQKNDTYGSPRMYRYDILGGEGRFSPTTLRYIKVLTDIRKFFDITKIHNITEIGIGYGGQCRIIKSYLSDVQNYKLIDLPQVIKLANRFLGPFELQGIDYINGMELPFDTPDLVISNYAFSELNRQVQEEYLNKIIGNSKCGYITWNELSHNMLDGYSKDEVISRLHGAHIVDEIPLTGKGNCIIIWGDSPSR